MSLTLIAAVARNQAIGTNNDLVWRSAEDMRRFKEATSGHAVIMGRKTWESLPPKFRPLPGRRNIVVTRQLGFSAPGAEVASSLEEAIGKLDQEEGFVIGGGDLYAQALPLANRLLLTEIDFAPEATVFFPKINASEWIEQSRVRQTDLTGIRFDFVEYRKG